jgi:hypothetical protein
MSASAESVVSRKVRIALDETRLLILGAQILFGFQLQAVFQQLFSELPMSSRYLECAAQVLMTISVACLTHRCCIALPSRVATPRKSSKPPPSGPVLRCCLSQRALDLTFTSCLSRSPAMDGLSPRG